MTNLEAVDAAVRPSITVRRFEDGADVKTSYDPIIATFSACLDSTGRVFGLRDRAYRSAQAIMWIHIRALCVSRALACNFPLPALRTPTSNTSGLSIFSIVLEFFGSIQFSVGLSPCT